MKREKLYRWYELSEEIRRKAVKRYGVNKIDELVLYSDALFDENGYVIAY